MDFNKLFSFLTKLSQNNNREWFNNNKKEYTQLKNDFEKFIQTIIPKIKDIDPSIGIVEAKDCIFRIYRDVRFSPNKDPYKIHFGAYISNGGRKSRTCGYYLHFQPGESFIAAGAYAPEANILKEIRYEIMDHIDSFKKIIENKGFMKFYPYLSGEKLKTAPKGFPKDFADIELLKFKSYEVFHSLPENMMNSSEIDNYLLEAVATAVPYNRFFNKVIEFTIHENKPQKDT